MKRIMLSLIFISALAFAHVPGAIESDDPFWGCGLVGTLPGIDSTGAIAPETQKLVDGIKGSSSFNMVSYWNWDYAPKVGQYLTKDFIFMPEIWGAQAAIDNLLHPANQTATPSPARVGTLLLGMNEPDIVGSCMGNLFGRCVKSCSADKVQQGTCPAATLDPTAPPVPCPDGECNCWEKSYPTGVGFWPLEGCHMSTQPLPVLWEDPECVNIVMENWRQTAASALRKGYKYLSTPLVAKDINYAQKFIETACSTCQDITCGCPVYIGFHFYAFDCRPASTGGYDQFREKLANVTHIMEMYPFVKGAIINEVGMLNCAPASDEPICVPDSGQNPASKQPDHDCPETAELPNGLASYMEELFDIMIAATVDGRPVVKGFSWFNEDQDGGTYNLRLFHQDGSLNDLGEAYIRGCTRWQQGTTTTTTTTTMTSPIPLPVQHLTVAVVVAVVAATLAIIVYWIYRMCRAKRAREGEERMLED